MAIFRDIDPEDFNFSHVVKEVLDILTNKTNATALRAILYGDLYPNGVLTFDQVPMLPDIDPTQDLHATSKSYVERASRRATFFGVLNE